MTATRNLFDNPALDVDGVIKSTISIFVARWKTFICIGFAQTATVLAALLASVFLFIQAGLNASVFQCLAQMTNTPGATFVADHALFATDGVHSRMLMSYFDTNDDNKIDCDDVFEKLAENAGHLIGLFFVLCLLIGFIGAFYNSAMVHAAALVISNVMPNKSKKREGDTYKNIEISVFTAFVLAISYVMPNASHSMSHGRKKMCSVFCFTILYCLALNLVVLVAMIPTFIWNQSGLVIFLCVVAIIGLYFYSSCLMFAAVPAIVIEGKSATSAFYRSREMCQKSVCYILSMLLCSIFLTAIAGIVLGIFEALFPTRISWIFTITRIATNLVFPAIFAIMHVVMYVSLRVKAEGLTQNKLSEELSTDGETMYTPIVTDNIECQALV